MADYRLILSLIVQGYSYRQIEAMASCSHRAIAKAHTIVKNESLTTTDQVEALTVDDLDRFFTDGRKNVDGDFVPIDVDAVINARIGRKKPPLKVLWARYLNTPAPTQSARHYRYERFCQIIAEHVRTHDLTSPITHTPGHTMQVDWAGTPMWITDPITRAVTKVSIFVATLPYSGMIFAYGCLDEKLSAWCDAHRRAFEYFGGVAQVIIPDNASTASNQISKYDKTRDVNVSYAGFLEHYNTAAVPTRAYRPKEKANVESGVKIVTNWIIHYLADRLFADIDDLGDAVADRVEWINDRTPFRSESKSRREWFTECEAGDLIGLPDQPWQDVSWKKAKASRDWHIQVDTIKYSVPATFVGTTVDVRIIGTRLDILAGGDIIASHRVGTKKHSYVTDADHAPASQGQTTGLWTRGYFLRQAAKTGPNTVDALTRLLDAKKIEAQGFRACMNILSLGKGDNRPLLEQACQTLCADERRPISYTAVKHQLTAIRAQAKQRPAVTPSPSPAPASAVSRDTSRAHLTGVDQFRLTALTNDERGTDQ
ncbi:IS21 family transposase [Brevibacterium aurantiacum]|uniref:Transposase n=1 Tax=Brevibacterium aurantiacum TaxID=273384 RepID=A0A3T0DUR7_BREAU|nr:IS21 family transposase [Brevibacterium aurantiacum]AZT98815.1 transposase [Brevibacterium aurantiacum]